MEIRKKEKARNTTKIHHGNNRFLQAMTRFDKLFFNKCTFTFFHHNPHDRQEAAG